MSHTPYRLTMDFGELSPMGKQGGLETVFLFERSLEVLNVKRHCVSETETLGLRFHVGKLLPD
ncbi:hypothetical protein Lepto7376_1725 [[Leptolyngbya] sp. PCC 7376]|nr:hypothetical protein Lepto7376_1725 [[Leptolyngbya] sp. PCC 7376]